VQRSEKKTWVNVPFSMSFESRIVKEKTNMVFVWFVQQLAHELRGSFDDPIFDEFLQFASALEDGDEILDDAVSFLRENSLNRDVDIGDITKRVDSVRVGKRKIDVSNAWSSCSVASKKAVVNFVKLVQYLSTAQTMDVEEIVNDAIESLGVKNDKKLANLLENMGGEKKLRESIKTAILGTDGARGQIGSNSSNITEGKIKETFLDSTSSVRPDEDKWSGTSDFNGDVVLAADMHGRVTGLRNGKNTDGTVNKTGFVSKFGGARWNDQKDKKTWFDDADKKTDALSIAISPDGKRIVSSSDSTHARVLNRKNDSTWSNTDEQMIDAGSLIEDVSTTDNIFALACPDGKVDGTFSWEISPVPLPTGYDVNRSPWGTNWPYLDQPTFYNGEKDPNRVLCMSRHYNGNPPPSTISLTADLAIPVTFSGSPGSSENGIEGVGAVRVTTGSLKSIKSDVYNGTYKLLPHDIETARSFGMSVSSDKQGERLAVAVLRPSPTGGMILNIDIFSHSLYSTGSSGILDLEQTIVVNSSPHGDFDYLNDPKLVSMSENGDRLVIGCGKLNNYVGNVEIWTRTGIIWTKQSEIPTAISSNTRVVMSSSGNYIMSATMRTTGSTVKIFDIQDPSNPVTKLTREFSCPDLSISISPSGQYATIGDGCTESVHILYDIDWSAERILNTEGAGEDGFGKYVCFGHESNNITVMAPGSGKFFVYYHDGSTTWSRGSVFEPDVDVTGCPIHVEYPTGYASQTAMAYHDNEYFFIPAEDDSYVFKYTIDPWSTVMGWYSVHWSGFFQDQLTVGDSANISADGKFAMISAANDHSSGDIESGSVYIYENEGDDWTLKQKLILPTSIQERDFRGFGHSTCATPDFGTIAILASRGGQNYTGEVIVYEKNGDVWEETGSITYTPHDSHSVQPGVDTDQYKLFKTNNDHISITDGGTRITWATSYNGVFIFDRTVGGSWVAAAESELSNVLLTNDDDLNYFGHSDPVPDVFQTLTSDITLPVTTTTPGVSDGDMKVVTYPQGLDIRSTCTITTDTPCRGLLIYIAGDLYLDGTISMTGKGAAADPNAPGATDSGVVPASGLRIPFRTISGTGTSSDNSALFAGCGIDARDAISRHATKNLEWVTIGRDGGLGGTGSSSHIGNAGVSGGVGQSGGGGSGSAWSGTSGSGGAGTCFSGGTGGGGAHGGTGVAGAPYGGSGGDGAPTASWPSAGGVGNPNGKWSNGTYVSNGIDTSAPSGTGGTIILIVGGNVTIGPNGKIEANGISSQNYSDINRCGGGSSGGGNIVIAHGGDFINNGSITADGGASWGWNSSQMGGAGGNGSIQIKKIIGNNRIGTGSMMTVRRGKYSDISGDGTTIAALFDGTLYFIKEINSTWVVVCQIDSVGGSGGDVKLSSDGSRCAVCSNFSNEVKIYDKTGTDVWTHVSTITSSVPTQGDFSSCYLSRDGKKLAYVCGYGEKMVEIYENEGNAWILKFSVSDFVRNEFWINWTKTDFAYNVAIDDNASTIIGWGAGYTAGTNGGTNVRILSRMGVGAGNVTLFDGDGVSAGKISEQTDVIPTSVNEKYDGATFSHCISGDGKTIAYRVDAGGTNGGTRKYNVVGFDEDSMLWSDRGQIPISQTNPMTYHATHVAKLSNDGKRFVYLDGATGGYTEIVVYDRDDTDVWTRKIDIPLSDVITRNWPNNNRICMSEDGDIVVVQQDRLLYAYELGENSILRETSLQLADEDFPSEEYYNTNIAGMDLDGDTLTVFFDVQQKIRVYNVRGEFTLIDEYFLPTPGGNYETLGHNNLIRRQYARPNGGDYIYEKRLYLPQTPEDGPQFSEVLVWNINKPGNAFTFEVSDGEVKESFAVCDGVVGILDSLGLRIYELNAEKNAYILRINDKSCKSHQRGSDLVLSKTDNGTIIGVARGIGVFYIGTNESSVGNRFGESVCLLNDDIVAVRSARADAVIVYKNEGGSWNEKYWIQNDGVENFGKKIKLSQTGKYVAICAEGYVFIYTIEEDVLTLYKTYSYKDLNGILFNKNEYSLESGFGSDVAFSPDDELLYVGVPYNVTGEVIEFKLEGSDENGSWRYYPKKNISVDSLGFGKSLCVTSKGVLMVGTEKTADVFSYNPHTEKLKWYWWTLAPIMIWIPLFVMAAATNLVLGWISVNGFLLLINSAAGASLAMDNVKWWIIIICILIWSFLQMCLEVGGMMLGIHFGLNLEDGRIDKKEQEAMQKSINEIFRPGRMNMIISKNARSFSEEIRQHLIDAGEKLDDKFDDLKDKIDDGATDLKDKIDDGVADLKDKFDDGVADFKDKFDDLKDKFDDGVTDLKDKIDDGATDLKDKFDDGVADLKDKFDDGATDLKDKFDDGVADLKEKIEEMSKPKKKPDAQNLKKLLKRDLRPRR
jgi:hypothetical protein